MTGHARFAPSDAHRWLHCHGAIPLQERLIAEGATQPFTGNIYTREGTAAHTLFHKVMTSNHRDVDRMVKAIPSIDGFPTIDMRAPMRDAVDYATSWISRLPHFKVSFEQRLRIDAIGDFGTGDMILISRVGLVAHIFDLKWGEGVAVSARGNPQLGLYALGAVPMNLYQVHLHIIQPRIREGAKTRHWAAPKGWDATLDSKARAAIVAARKPKPALTPSDDACRFCINKGHCPATAARALADFKDHMPKKLPAKPKAAKPIAAQAVARLTHDQMGELLALRPFVDLFYAALAEAVWSALMAGKRVARWKMVESRTQRQWKDIDKVMAAFKRKGISLDDFMPRTLVGITRGESLLDDDKLMAALCMKQTGEPTIAPEADNRPALVPSNARKDFGV